MPHYASLWIRFGGLAVVIVLCAALAVPFLIPVDDYRPLLVDAIDNATGRQVEIDGLKLNLFPNVHVSVEGFRLRNPPGFPAGNALTAKVIDLGLNTRALLSRRLDVTYIAPSGVRLNLLRDDTGRTNVTLAPHNASANRNSGVTIERIGKFDVKGATVTFATLPQRGQPSFSLGGVDASVGSIDPQEKNFVQKIAVGVDLRGAQLTTSLLAKPVDFHGGALDFENGSGRGTFTLSIANVDLSGEIAFTKLDPLAISFAVKSPQIDLDALQSLVLSGGETRPTGSSRLLARGTARVGKITFATFDATNLSGQLRVYTNGLQAQNCALSAYGGSARGNASIDTGKVGLPMSANVQIRGMSLKQVMAAIGRHGISGTLDADTRIAMLLQRNLEQGLTTNGTFSVRSGTLPSSQLHNFRYLGGDLRIAHERGYSSDLRLLAKGIQATLRGSFGFDQTLSYVGTAIVNAPAELKSARQLRVIFAQAMQRELGTSRAAVPFTIYGSFSNPQFKMTGTPQLVNSSLQTQNATLPSSLQSILKKLPAL